jgi:DnaJ-class molecular chaperone
VTGERISFDPRVDYYAALGVAPGASDAEIKEAYRKLAKQNHPDATGGDKARETRFKEVTQAYDVLGDKAKRQQYDALRSGAAFRGGADPFAAGAGVGGTGFSFDFGDLLSQMFAGGAGRTTGRGQVRYEVFTDGGDPFGEPFQARREPRRQRRAHRHDSRADVRVRLDEALLGTVKEVTTPAGRAKLKIPPGTSSGTKLRLRGKGPPIGGGAHGDHYVTVHIDVPKRPLDDEAQQLLAALMKKLR